MLTIPSAVEDALKNGAQKNFRVHFPNGERADITNDNIVSESVSFTESICSQSELKFGLAEASVLEFETVGVENIRGAEIEASVGIECEEEVDLTPYSDGESKSGDDYTYTVEGENIIFRGDTYGSYFMLQESFELEPSKTYKLSGCPAGGSMIGYSLRANGNRSYFVFDDNDYALITGESSLRIWIYVNYSGELVFAPKLVEVEYPISYGKFVVDECPRQTNLEHRKVTAYSVGSSLSQNWNGVEKWRRETPNNNYTYTYNPAYSALVQMGLTERINDFTYTLNTTETEGNIEANIDIGDSRETYTLGFRYTHLNKAVISPVNRLFYLEDSGVTPLDMIKNQISADFDMFTDTEKRIFEKVGYCYENCMCGSTTEYSVLSPGEATNFNMLSRGNYFSDDTSRYTFGLLCEITVSSPTVTKTYTVRDSVDYYEVDMPYPFPADTIEKTKVSGSGIAALYVVPSDAGIKPNEAIEGFIELLGAFGKCDRNGYFKLKTLDFTNTNYSLEKSDYSSCWYEEKMTMPYGKVCCTFKDSSGNELYAEKIINDVNPSLTYDLTNNALIQNFAFSEEAMDSILETFADNVESIQYIGSDISSIGLPFLEAGDVLSVEIEDGYITTFVEKRTLSGVQALFDDISAETCTETIISGSSGSSGGGSVSPTPVAVNDGQLTIKQGSVGLGSFTANQSSDTVITIPEAPTVNDGTLTIKQGGTTLGTFSANQSGNTTVNITGGGGGGLDLLWTNSSPGSSFTAKTLSLAVSTYAFLLIEIRFTTTTDNYATVIVRTNGHSFIEAFLASANRYRRSITASGSSVTFGSGEKASPSATTYSTDNTCYIPVAIYGMK